MGNIRICMNLLSPWKTPGVWHVEPLFSTDPSAQQVRLGHHVQSELLTLLHRPKNEWLALKDGPVLIMIFHLVVAMNLGLTQTTCLWLGYVPMKLATTWGILHFWINLRRMQIKSQSEASRPTGLEVQSHVVQLWAWHVGRFSWGMCWGVPLDLAKLVGVCTL